VLQVLGDRIKLIREDKKMGLNETAELAGISGSYLSTIENGIKKNPSMKTLSKIAAALEVSVDEFFKDGQIETNKEEEQMKNDKESDFKPTLSVKEQEKLDAEAEKMLAELRISFSQNKGHLKDADYEMLSVTVKALLEQMTKNNKQKYTPNIYKKSKNGNK
jgi:transcriptional regulator with XRE-family HTH domain